MKGLKKKKNIQSQPQFSHTFTLQTIMFHDHHFFFVMVYGARVRVLDLEAVNCTLKSKLNSTRSKFTATLFSIPLYEWNESSLYEGSQFVGKNPPVNRTHTPFIVWSGQERRNARLFNGFCIDRGPVALLTGRKISRIGKVVFRQRVLLPVQELISLSIKIASSKIIFAPGVKNFYTNYFVGVCWCNSMLTHE